MLVKGNDRCGNATVREFQLRPNQAQAPQIQSELPGPIPTRPMPPETVS